MPSPALAADLVIVTADIVERGDRAVTIRTKAGRFADLPLAHIDIAPAPGGRHFIELPFWLASEHGI